MGVSRASEGEMASISKWRFRKGYLPKMNSNHGMHGVHGMKTEVDIAYDSTHSGYPVHSVVFFSRHQIDTEFPQDNHRHPEKNRRERAVDGEGAPERPTVP